MLILDNKNSLKLATLADVPEKRERESKTQHKQRKEMIKSRNQ